MAPRMVLLGFLLALGLAAAPLHAETAANGYAPKVTNKYAGGFPDDFPVELQTVQSLLSPIKLDVSSKLGLLQYQETFQHPVSLRFDDGAPAISENPFFYIQPGPADKPFSQELVVNVEA